MFRDILLPIDGSEHASRAAAAAGELAAKFGANVFVLHVIDRGEIGTEERRMAEVEHIVEPGHEYSWTRDVPRELHQMLEPADTDTQRDQILGFLARKVVTPTLETLREQGADPHKVRVVFKEGHPARRILETIEDEGIDLVVMGSRGLSNIAGVLQGSVSSRVSHAAPCPVLTVK